MLKKIVEKRNVLGRKDTGLAGILQIFTADRWENREKLFQVMATAEENVLKLIMPNYRKDQG